MVFEQLNEWFNVNLLSLYFDKTGFIHFITKNAHELDKEVQYEKIRIANVSYTKFLGITLHDILYWQSHTEFHLNLVQHVMPLEYQYKLCHKKRW
jgi:hypothetical protein